MVVTSSMALPGRCDWRSQDHSHKGQGVKLMIVVLVGWLIRSINKSVFSFVETQLLKPKGLEFDLLLAFSSNRQVKLIKSLELSWPIEAM